MLTPTHVQIAVLHTKDLIVKGKNGTNDAFIIFSLGKQKFQSSVKEKVSDQVLEWNEGCDIPIPSSESNKSEVVLKVLHKASIGDKFLGRVALPLSQFDVTAKPRPKWYPLKPKPGNEKDTKYRGEIEVRISFLIKSTPGNGSSNDLANKSKQKEGFRSSLGSILSLGKKKKKKDKEKSGYSSNSKESLSSGSKDSLRYGSTSSRIFHLNNNLPVINDDPGVISEDEEEDDRPLELKIDERLKSNNSSVPDILNTSLSSLPMTPKSIHRSGHHEIMFEDEEEESRDTMLIPAPANSRKSSYDKSMIATSPKPKKFQLPSVIVEEEVSSSSAIHEPFYPSHTAPATPEPQPKLTVSASMSNLMDSSSGKGSVRKTFKAMFSPSKHLSVDDIYHPADGSSANSSNGSFQNHSQKSFGVLKRSPSLRELKIPKETYKQYERKSKEELVAIIVGLKNTVDDQKQKIGDLEDYIDKLLLRVLDNMPSLLKNGGSVRVRE